MNKLFATLALSLLFICPVDAQKIADKERSNLTGPVRTVRAEMADYMEGNVEGKESRRQLDAVTYDLKGNQTERIVYDGYGFLVGKDVYTYNPKEYLTEIKLYDPKGAVLNKRLHTYDTNGKLAQIVSYDARGGVILRQSYSYDANGNMSEEVYYDSKKAVGKTAYRFDDKGNNVEVAYYLANGSKAIARIGPCLGAHRIVYAYDAKRRPHEVVAYETDGSVKKRWLYTYDIKGNIAEEISEDAWSRSKSVSTYEWDSQGNWIKQMIVMSVVTDSKRLVKGMSSQIPEMKKAIFRTFTYY